MPVGSMLCYHRSQSITKSMPDWIFNPIIFEIGPIKAHWYGFMYALSFILGYLYVNYSKLGKKLDLSQKDKDNLVIIIIAGVILGGRLGYILFYNLEFYLSHPEKIFAVWEGGMSFHGGLLGSALGMFLFSKQKKIDLWKIADVITSFAPIGIMLVRIANFINGELYGRIATQYCIYFPTDPENCRYPSQLIQAALEGLILFLILQWIARKNPKTGVLSGSFLILYGLFRIAVEFVREPDPQIGFLWDVITQGQLLSILMVGAGAILLIIRRKK